jgi:carbonic anhydrase/acetyltransferase-like protein (isoleucine patch superfamily)
MKKYLGFVIVLVMFAMPLVSNALEFRGGEQPSVSKNEKISEDLYMGGGSVTSAGSIKGDLVTGGGNILVSGDVSGDLMAGGGNISILSNVGDDVRVGGGTVILSGKVGGDLIVGGGQVNISGTGVGGDAVIGAGNLSIDAPIAGNVYIGGGNVYINAPIGGNVKIEAEKVTLGSSAVMSGTLTYKAKNELTKESGAVVKGEVKFEPIKNKNVAPVAIAALVSAAIVWKFFALLACALLVGLMLRRFNKEVVHFAMKRPFFELGRGVLVMIAMPIISILFFVTVVGIPFGIAGLLGYALVMLFVWIISPIVLGSILYGYLFKKEIEVSWKTILLGVVIYSVLGIIPVLGWLAQMVLMLITLGSMIALKLQIVKEWR